MSRHKPHHISTRRNCIIAVSQGVTQSEVARRYQVDKGTLCRWLKALGIKKGDGLTEEEIDARLAKLAETEREGVTDAREIAKLNRKWGLSKPKPPPANPRGPRKPREVIPSVLEPLLVSEEVTVEDYDRAIQQFTQQIAAEMGQETTIEGQIKAMTGGLLLEQLRLLKGNLPPVATWADVERVVKLTRLNFGMDDAAKGVKRVDLGLLNGKAPMVKAQKREKVIDAVVVPQETDDDTGNPEPEVGEEEEEFEI